MTGDIMTVSRLRMGTDGKGVSTLVTFFGCPLHCKYCINNFCHEADNAFDDVPRGAYTPEELFAVLEKDDIFRLTDVVDLSKLRVRVPGIPGYNDGDKIRESVKWIKDVMKVKPEVFDYIVPAGILCQ